MNAPADQNFVRAKMGVLNTDGLTLVTIKINPATGGMKVNTTDTISFTMRPIAPEDENYNKVLLWQGTDGLTYPWVVDSEGKVLIAL
jgi:uncharacterized protein YjdB